MNLCFHLLIVLSVGVFIEGYRILAVFPNPMHSHYTLTVTILKELVKRGHQVTVISPYPQKTPIENFTDISISSIIETVTERKKGLYELESSSVVTGVNFITQMGYIVTELALAHPDVQKLLHSNQTFDLLMTAQFMNEATMGFANHYKVPTVLLVSMPPFAWSSFILAHPSPSSYVPNLFSPFSGHMNFWQRFQNTFYDLYSILYYQLIMLPKHRHLVSTYFPGSPDLYDFVNNVSLVLLNSHYSVYDATPRVPNVFEIGGFHVNPKPIPSELKEFLDSSTNGVVVFSMGSNLKSSDLADDKREAILNSFARLKQNVLWKWEADHLVGQPKNVKLMKWLPLQDVLAHPNIVAFISHGGLLSTTESIYHGVPIVGIPVFSDQKMNIATACSYGYAAQVPLAELTEEALCHALNEVLNNPKYRKNAMARSKIMRDTPMKLLDVATYWIEHVVRHDGAPHLKYAGVDLNWFQRNMLDVIAVYIIILVIVFKLLRTSLKFILCKTIFSKNIKKKTN